MPADGLEILSTPEGIVEVAALPGQRFKVSLRPRSSDLYVPALEAETTLSLELIELLLRKIGYAWLCDALERHDDPGIAHGILRRQLFAYFDAEEFAGKRLMDFGCGTGASAFALATMMPDTEIVGIELSADLLAIARRIADFRKLPNVRFVQSPAGNRVPDEGEPFDFIVLSAVYEHLLPEERKVLMPSLWAVLRTGGVLFVSQTPHRYFPYEHHSTGLWLINYLPDRAAHWMARNFARLAPEANRSRSWSDHLRGGLRGATEWEIVRNVGGSSRAVILQPDKLGVRSRAEYWLSGTNPDRHRRLKRLIARLFALSDRFTGTIPTMNIDVAIKKLA